jgi:hypothetical protein
MNMRFSRLAISLFVVAAVVLAAGRGWAVYFELGQSPDEWGLKYNVEVGHAGGDKATVRLTLADAGRLTPIYSIHVIALSLKTDSQGGRSYDVKEKIELKPTDDGRYAGQVEIGREFLDRAEIRFLTLTLDGKRQTSGARYYDVPLAKFVSPAAAAGAPPPRPSIAAPPSAPKVRK